MSENNIFENAGYGYEDEGQVRRRNNLSDEEIEEFKRYM